MSYASIFGETRGGVPSPMVLVHPAEANYPRYGQRLFPYSGLGCDGNAACAACAGMVPSSVAGFGGCGCSAAPPGLTGFGDPLMYRTSSNALSDALAGAAACALVGNGDTATKIAWAVAGALAGVSGGMVGVLSVAGMAAFVRYRKK